jgi:hypothetical protein
MESSQETVKREEEGVVSASVAAPVISCQECGAVFEKRNALFRHLEVLRRTSHRSCLTIHLLA